MWKTDLDIFIYALYIQVILVIAVVVAAYILYFIYKIRNITKKKHVEQIKEYLLAISDPKQTTKLPFKRRWKKLGLLLLAIKEIEKDWEPQKLEFVKKYMLPIARKYARKTGWFSRFLAAKTFAIYAMPEDEKIVAKLIQDYRPAVVIEAIHAIVHLPTKLLLNILIDKIATLRRKSYDIYLEPFKHLSNPAREIIVTRLMSEKDAYKRDICYRILVFFAPEPLAEVARKDAKAETIELCLSAIHFIAYAEDKKALPFLHQMLDDPRWQIKVGVLQALGKLRDTSSVDIIAKTLNSPEWWVRINACNTLKRIGKAGIKKLKISLDDKSCLSKPEIQYILQDSEQKK